MWVEWSHFELGKTWKQEMTKTVIEWWENRPLRNPTCDQSSLRLMISIWYKEFRIL